MVHTLDTDLVHLIHHLTIAGHAGAAHYAAAPGAGAAGGLGFAGLLLGGHTVSGADYFLDLLNFETHLQGCDLVITGEGRMDDQTLNGKLPAIIAKRAGHIPVIAVVGRSDISPAALAADGHRSRTRHHRPHRPKPRRRSRPDRHLSNSSAAPSRCPAADHRKQRVTTVTV